MNHIQSSNREHRRAAAKYLQEENRRWPEHLRLWPREEWPDGPMRHSTRLLSVYRSRTYLVQVFNEAAPVLVRLSVNRTAITPAGGWQQDIPWEDLQRLKREAGYGDFDAVEVFPRDRDLVNVANMRHLWVMANPLPFGWRADTSGVRVPRKALPEEPTPEILAAIVEAAELEQSDPEDHRYDDGTTAARAIYKVVLAAADGVPGTFARDSRGPEIPDDEKSGPLLQDAENSLEAPEVGLLSNLRTDEPDTSMAGDDDAYGVEGGQR